MPTELKTWDVQDDQGKVYKVQGPVDATPDELFDAVQGLYFSDESATPEPVSTPEAPRQQAPAPAPAAQPEAAPLAATDTPNAVQQNYDSVVSAPSKALENDPAATQFLEGLARSDLSFNELRDQFTAKYPEYTNGFASSVTPAALAARRAYVQTPEGFNSPIVAPIQRPTGMADPNAPDTISGEFGQSAVRSLANMANTVTGVAGVAADIVGADETAESLVNKYVEDQAAIQQNYPSSAGRATEIGSFDDAGRWVASTLGELAPQLTSGLTAGLAGGVAGRKIAQRGAAELVEEQVEQGVAREAAQAAVAAAARRGALRGQVAGAGAMSEVQEVGSIYGDTYGETGERMPWTSLLAGTAAASLDTILPATILSKIGGPVAQDAIVGGLVKRLGKAAASNFLLEGGTEALQTVIEGLPAGGPIDWDNVLEAALRGGFGGSVAGTATEGYQMMREDAARPPVPARTSLPGGTIVAPTAPSRRSVAYRNQIAETGTQIADQINTLTESWQNKPTFEVHQNFNNIDGLDNNAIGAVLDGNVSINTEAVLREAKRRDVTPETIVQAVTFHEGLGHHGMSQQFGVDLDNKLSEILSSSPTYQKRVENWLMKNPDAYLNDPNRDVRAFDEILAERSENGKLPASFVNILANTIKDFGRRMGMDLKYSTREVETILGMAHAAVISGKGRNVQDNGFRFMYAGEKSKRANPVTLQRAKERASFGLDSRKELGWFPGPDGKWRYEIDDSFAAPLTAIPDDLNERIMADTGYNEVDDKGGMMENLADPKWKADYYRGEAELDEVIDHPALFEAYPELREYEITRNPDIMDFGQRMQGWFDPKTKRINITPYAKEPMSTLLHEIQHAIQQIEGFAFGGNDKTAINKLSDEKLLAVGEKVADWQRTLLDKERAKVQALGEFARSPEGKAWREAHKADKDVGKERSALRDKLEAQGVSNAEMIQHPEYTAMMERHRQAFQAYREFGKNFLENLGLNERDLPKQVQVDYYEMMHQIIRPETVEEVADNLRKLRDKYVEDEKAQQKLVKALDEPDYGTVRKVLKKNDALGFQAYEHLFGEVEARDVQKRLGLGKEGRKMIEPYSQEPQIEPDDYIFTYEEEQSNSSSPRARYMMMSSPDKVVMTEEEIAGLTDGDLFESENAMHILNDMTKGYTPVVMSMDSLKQEVESRGLPPSRVLRNKGIGAGELVKRLFQYDIAMEAFQNRATELWNKLQTADFTQADKADYLRLMFKMEELSGRIFEDQGEIARALASMKSINFTRRRVQGVKDTLGQFTAEIKEDSPYASLNDEEQFYKFAKAVQDQIENTKQTRSERANEFGAQVISLPRALMSTLDLSAPLRQGIFLIHKAAWWKAFANMFRFAGSTRAFNDMMENITSRPTYDQMVEGNLALSNLGTKMTQREEAFMSTWAEKIPGFGKLVRGSERAYTGFLNQLRADVFDQLVAKLPEQPSNKDLRDIASFVNSASGRGNLPASLNGAMPLLSGALFSPRLMASRLDMTTRLVRPSTYITMNPVARKEYIKSVMAVGGLALLVNGLLSMAGAEVEKDPRSSDFMKPKFGDTRYDILGGEGQYVVAAARIVMNSYKTTDGAVKSYGNGFGQRNRWDDIEKFLTNKAAPVPSFVIDYLRGVNAVGDEFNMDEAIVQRMTPMLVQDVAEVMSEEDSGRGFLMSTPGLFGVGVQSYSSASMDTEEALKASEDFKMEDVPDGEYSSQGYRFEAEDGIIKIDEAAQEEWGRRINLYYSEWMKDEMAAEDWEGLPEDDKRDVIAKVRSDARKEAKAEMVELLGLAGDELPQPESINE